MSVKEIKSKVHEMIDAIEDENVLKELFAQIQHTAHKVNKDWWDELTPEQQQELDLAIKESEDENNLVSHDDVKKMAREWLKK